MIKAERVREKNIGDLRFLKNFSYGCVILKRRVYRDKKRKRIVYVHGFTSDQFTEPNKTRILIFRL